TVPQTENIITGTIDGKPLVTGQVALLTAKESWSFSSDSAFEKLYIKAGDTLQTSIRQLMGTGKNYLVLVDASHKDMFGNYSRAGQMRASVTSNILMISGVSDVQKFATSLTRKTHEAALKNVVGMIPGKSKKEEFVIFSGHYDHLGIGAPNAKGDSIFNGANDDAAGTTAVIMLAKYFKQLANNERTLIFAAFTAEEVGGFGSQYFSQQFDPQNVMAMFNIEMIGTESKWGKNSAYITGYEKTNMGEILQANLKGTGFEFHPDPYTTENLFYRSDNATLARLGVPAHTISTAKMEGEPHYHKPSDEVKTLDLENMAQIIRSIAESSKTIVSGKDTPTRVKPEGGVRAS
ncbi:MAG: M28 family peptidase, partial [Chitinophagaceae bacterium]